MLYYIIQNGATCVNLAKAPSEVIEFDESVWPKLGSRMIAAWKHAKQFQANVASISKDAQEKLIRQKMATVGSLEANVSPKFDSRMIVACKEAQQFLPKVITVFKDAHEALKRQQSMAINAVKKQEEALKVAQDRVHAHEKRVAALEVELWNSQKVAQDRAHAHEERVATLEVELWNSKIGYQELVAVSSDRKQMLEDAQRMIQQIQDALETNKTECCALQARHQEVQSMLEQSREQTQTAKQHHLDKLGEAQRKVEAMEKVIRQKDDCIMERDNLRATLRRNHEELLQKKDAEIESMRAENGRLTSRPACHMGVISDTLQNKDTELEALKAETEQLSSRIANSDALLQQKASEIESLQADNAWLSLRPAMEIHSDAKFEWQYEDCGEWHSFAVDANARTQRSYMDYLKNGAAATLQLDSGGASRIVDFKKMEQTNQRTSRSRIVRCESWDVRV